MPHAPPLQLELFDAMRYKFDPGNPDYLTMVGEQNRRTLALNARELSRNPQVTCFLFGSSCRAAPRSWELLPPSKAPNCKPQCDMCNEPLWLTASSPRQGWHVDWHVGDALPQPQITGLRLSFLHCSEQTQPALCMLLCSI